MEATIEMPSEDEQKHTEAEPGSSSNAGQEKNADDVIVGFGDIVGSGGSSPQQLEQIRVPEGGSVAVRLFTDAHVRRHAHFVKYEVNSYYACNSGLDDNEEAKLECAFCAAGLPRANFALIPAVDLQSRQIGYLRASISTKPNSLFLQLVNFLNDTNRDEKFLEIMREGAYQYVTKAQLFSPNADRADDLVEEFNQNIEGISRKKYFDQMANGTAYQLIPEIKRKMDLFDFDEDELANYGIRRA